MSVVIQSEGANASKHERLQQLKTYLGSHIIGQDHVIDEMCPWLHAGEFDLRHPRNPTSFLFMGPTGSGKTETARLVSQYLDRTLIRVDMSEFTSPETIRGLLGDVNSPRGLLGQRVDASNGSGVLLFDEIEKAHPRVLDIFLQVLHPGRVTLGDHSTLDLSPYYIFATANIGSSEILHFEKTRFTTMQRVVIKRAMELLRVEVVNRFSLLSVFAQLTHSDLMAIAELETVQELERLKAQGYALSCDHSVIPFILSRGYDKRFGARRIQNTVQRYVHAALTSAVLAGGATSGELRHDSQLGALVISEGHRV